jgi:hypothetical protein
MRDIEQDALDAYERAHEQTELLMAEWEALDRPVLARGSKGQEVAHPLLAELRAATRLEDELRHRLSKKHRGPQPSAVVSTIANRRITRRGARLDS